MKPLSSLLVVLAFSSGAQAQEPIAAWGDSLTQGLFMTPETTYPAIAQSLLGAGAKVENFGVAAQTLTQTGARIGAIPVVVTVKGDAIPGEGPVDVLKESVHILNSQLDLFVENAGTLCSVPGTVRGLGFGGWTFTRSAPGAAVPCPPDSIFVPDMAEQRDATLWLWLGSARPDIGHTVEGDVAEIVAFLGHDRYLIGSVMPSRSNNAKRLADIAVLNASLKATYGDHFVDLVTPLQAAGDGSARDNEDIAKGIVPRSLRVDEISLRAPGYRIVAQAFVDAMAKLGD